MDKILAPIKGKKTYIISALMVLIGIVNLISGDINFSQFLASEDLDMILFALMGAGFRHRLG